MLDPRFEEGLSLYHEGRYWESHETWEDQWRRVAGMEAELYRALIQLDAALIHIERRDWRGVQRLLARLLKRLQNCPERFNGLNVVSLREQVGAMQAEVGLIQSGEKDAFDWRLKPGLAIDDHNADHESC